MNPLFELRPISTPPQEKGFYLLTTQDHQPLYACSRFYSKRKKCWEGGTNECTHYLAPCSSPGAVWVKAADITDKLHSRMECGRINRSGMYDGPIDKYGMFFWDAIDKRWHDHLQQTVEIGFLEILRESGTLAPVAKPVDGMNFLAVLEENYEATKSGEPEVLFPGMDKKAAVLETYEDLISIYKSKPSSTPSAREAELEREVAKLKAWKQQAIEVMPDFQAIGKEMGVPLGHGISDKILPWITAKNMDNYSLKQEVERLKGLIFEAHFHGHDNGFDGATEADKDDSWKEFKKQHNL